MAAFIRDVLADLNEEQAGAVLAPFDVPLFIYAGAGSGKTRTLICRMAYMINSGIAPEKILAITFTRKAADEIRERLKQFVGPRAGKVVTRTFHQLCLGILREHPFVLGMGSDFKVADPVYQKKIVQAACKMILLKNNGLEQSPHVLQLLTSKMVNFVRRAKTMFKTSEDFTHDLAFILRYYEDQMKKGKRIDFMDFMVYTEKLLKENPRIAWEYGKTYEYVLIDEFQDTSALNFKIIRMIMGKTSQKIAIVGDIRQAIYGFRGADPRNISLFLKDYPMAARIDLKRNYRSTQTILNAAQSLIAKDANEDRAFAIPLVSYMGQGDLIKVIEAHDGMREVEMICEEIEQLVQPGSKYQYKDILIMFRVRKVSAEIEMELFRHGIPHTHKRGVGFFLRRDVREVIAYARLALAFADDEPDPNQLIGDAFAAVMNVPNRNIGLETLKELKERAGTRSILAYAKTLNTGDFGKVVLGRIQKFIELINRIHNQICVVNEHLTPDSALQMIIDMTHLMEIEGTDTHNEPENIDEINEVITDFMNDKREILELLINEARRFGRQLFSVNTQTELTSRTSLQKFINAITLESKAQAARNAVTLSTIHQMKGLESPVCFIMRFNDGIIPICDSVTSDSATEGFDQVQTIEEERRIAYVAMTRAKEKLYISYCHLSKGKSMLPSIFLNEIDSSFISRSNVTEKQNQEVQALMTYVDDDFDDLDPT